MSKQKGKSSKKLVVPESVLKEQAELKQLKALNPTSLKEQIYSYKKQLNELISQVNNLNVSIAQNNEQYLKTTYQLQQTLKNEQNQLNEVKGKHLQVMSDCEATMKQSRKQWEVQKLDIIVKKNKEYNDAKDKLNDLTRKLENIKAFREKQQQYKDTIEELSKKIQNSQYIHKEQLNRIKQDHIKIRMKIEEDSKNKIQQIKSIEHQHAQAKLGDKEKHTKKQNQILENQIDLYKEEQTALAKQAQRLQIQIHEQQILLQELSNLNPTRQNHERSLKIINLQDKVNQLKTFLADQTKRLDNQLQSSVESFNKQHKDLQKQIKRVKDSCRKKDKQIKDLKLYSQMVLDQRGSIQWYLLQVLNDHPTLAAEPVANLDQLLRYLFMKINSGVHPNSWRHPQFISETKLPENRTQQPLPELLE